MDKFFIYTNPLAWVYFIICLIRLTFQELFRWSGIGDWWYVLIKLKRMNLENRKAEKKSLGES